MIRLADTFLARVLLISLFGITVLHLLSLWTYERTLQREMKQVHEEQLADKRKHLFDLRSQAVTEKLEDPSQLRKTRREIAQMQTVLRQRELEEAKKKSS